MTVGDSENRTAVVSPATPQSVQPTPMTRAIGRAALVLMVGNLTGSVLGFARQAVVANVFGLSHAVDAFYAASIVPQMFYDLTIGAAITAALIPTFTETVERHGQVALWRLMNSVLALVWVVLFAVTAVLFVIARPFMALVAGGLAPQKTQRVAELAVQPVRILVLTLFFLGTSAVLLSTLYSVRRFTVPAFAPSLYHLGIIAGGVFLARPLGVLALPVGAVAGSAAQAAAQTAALIRLRPSFHIRLTWTPEIKRIVTLYAPVAAGLVISVAGQIVDLHFKLHLRGRGGLSAMQIATTLTQFPIGIAVAALSFAILPSLSSAAAFDRNDSFKETLALGIRFVLFLTIPAAVGYIGLSVPIVDLLFQHGHHWQATDTTNTALALQGYALQIPFVGVDQLLIFAFYARRNTVTPMLVGIAGVAIYLTSAVLLLPRFQILGLAIANALQNSAHAGILLLLLVYTVGRIGGTGMARSLLTCLAAAGAMALVLFVLHGAFSDGGPAVRALGVVFPLSAGGLAYILVHAVFRSSELNLLVSLVAERLPTLRRT